MGRPPVAALLSFLLPGLGQLSWPFTIETRAKAPRPASGGCLISGPGGRLSTPVAV